MYTDPSAFGLGFLGGILELMWKGVHLLQEPLVDAHKHSLQPSTHFLVSHFFCNLRIPRKRQALLRVIDPVP